MPLEPARLFALELFGTAKATLADEGNVCRIAVAAVDGNNWHARIIKMFDDPQAGATYTVRFRARRIPRAGSISLDLSMSPITMALACSRRSP
jgi:hypothetical protein